MFRALTIAVTVFVSVPAFQAHAQQGRPTGTWASQGTGDCSGRDWASSDGVLPEAAKCATQTNGRIAVCWDGVTHKNQSRPGAWCTYKTVAPNECRGGGNPGVMYQCRATVVTAPPPASPVPPPAKPPIGPTASPPPASSAAAGTPGWVPRGFGDCTGNDWSSTDGLTLDAAKCAPQTANRVAVCWNQVTYKGPTFRGYAVSNCRDFGGVGCGLPAATAFCLTEGYFRATEHKVVVDGAQAWVLGSDKVCNDPGCGHLVDVVCTRK